MTDYLTTRELAELLRIKERKVYDLAANGSVPCTRATGKLLFPRKEVEAWIASNATRPAAAKARPDVILGSHDPLLDWALRESRCGLASYFDSSLDGLDRFEQADGIATGLHLFDAGADDWNRPLVEARFARSPVVLVEWARRARGLIVAAGREGDYPDIASLRGKQVVPRQAEAGSQVLLEHRLREHAIDTAEIDWTRPARSEVDAVIEVVEGRADATFGLAMLARQYRLGFVALIDEQFDLLVERRAWFEPPWQTLLEFCRSPAFRAHAKSLAGYDVGGLFRIRYNSPA